MFEGEEAGEEAVGERFDAGAVILVRVFVSFRTGLMSGEWMKEDAVVITPAVQIITY